MHVGNTLCHPLPTTSVVRTFGDAVLPLFTPITGADGREIYEIVVPKDATVI